MICLECGGQANRLTGNNENQMPQIIALIAFAGLATEGISSFSKSPLYLLLVIPLVYQIQILIRKRSMYCPYCISTRVIPTDSPIGAEAMKRYHPPED